MYVTSSTPGTWQVKFSAITARDAYGRLIGVTSDRARLHHVAWIIYGVVAGSVTISAVSGNEFVIRALCNVGKSGSINVLPVCLSCPFVRGPPRIHRVRNQHCCQDADDGDDDQQFDQGETLVPLVVTHDVPFVRCPMIGFE